MCMEPAQTERAHMIGPGWGPKGGFCREALALYSFPMRKAMAEGKRGWEPSTHLDLGRRRMRREHPIKS